jgi:hypothetical protein
MARSDLGGSGFEYIRAYYRVPAARGVRVRYSGMGPAREGVIISASGQYLWLRFDGETRRSGPYHPTWEMEYLVPAASAPERSEGRE